MTVRRYLSIALFFVLLSTQGRARVLNYTVDLRDTKSHAVHVTLKPVGFSAKTASFQMPIWAPGAYSVTHYGRYVSNFRAYNKKGDTLAVTRENDDRWQIANGKAVDRITYDVLDSHDDTTSLYFAMANIDTGLFFANATCLFGYYDDDKNAGATVKYMKPTDWKLTTELMPPPHLAYAAVSMGNAEFYAKNYDALADAPVIAAPNLIVKTFGVGNALYTVAVHSNDPFSNAGMDSLDTYLEKIVRAETDFFHETPFDHYTFIIEAPTPDHVTTFAQGALEHANSSDYLLTNFNWPLFKRSFLSIFSHEFFHLWNVKRIHSSLLGPFDYTKRVMTTSLWMAEGVTEYYAHTLLARYGITPPSDFFTTVKEWQHALHYAPKSAQHKSLEELSIDESDFKLDEAELFYTRGPLVAMMLDEEIRNRTNNQKSLDDVMLALNADAKKGKTFTDEELFPKVEKIVGLDLTDFYNRYIHGSDSLPIDHYLSMMGVNPSSASSQTAQLAFTPENQLMLVAVDSNSKLWRAGIKSGDVLYAINGTKITLDNVDLFSSMKDTMKMAIVTVLRGRDTLDVPIDFSEKQSSSQKREGGIELDPNATPLSSAIRKGILGSEHND